MSLNDMKHILFGLALMVGTFHSHAEPGPDKLLILGDSLSAGYGIEVSEGWVNLLQQRLQQQGYEYQIINASISGNTTADGLARLPKLLQTHQPSLVLVVLGGNDGLRGYPVKLIRRNLSQLIQLSRDNGAQAAITQIKIPPNYGKRYARLFHESFSSVAKAEQIALLPFLLDDIATQPGLMQNDGIHPNAKAQARILDKLWPHLQTIL